MSGSPAASVCFGLKPLIPKTNPPPPEPIMRQERIIQASIFDIFARHDMGRELQAMSQWLDEHHELLSLVASDLLRQGLRDTGLRDTGRQGLPAEAVLGCALLKQH